LLDRQGNTLKESVILLTPPPMATFCSRRALGRPNRGRQIRVWRPPKDGSV